MKNRLFIPWKGRMTLDLTIRRKLARVVCSAMISGLSLSFIIGEVVDAKAKQLNLWSAAPSVLPSSFLPLHPSVAAMAAIVSSHPREQLVALNSETYEAPAPNEKPSVFQDSLRTILAAPAEKEVESGRPRKVTASPKKEKLPIQDVEKVLLSIHDAAAMLSDQPAKRSPAMLSSARVVVKALPEKGSSEPVKEVVIRGEGGAREVSSAPWEIHGKVFADGQKLAGHFEVSLFNQIDQDGVPVGFPIAQQILPAGKTDFTLKVPGHIARGFLYGEFVATKTGERTWIAPPLNPWPKDERQFAELVFHGEDKISTVASASELSAGVSEQQENLVIRGTVSTLFASKPIYQEDVVVKVRGRKNSARTDKDGAFRLELPRVKGVLYLEFLKAGYQPGLVAVNTDKESAVVNVELASRNAIEQIAQRLGLRQSSTRGVFLGKSIGKDGRPLKGLAADITTKADGPYYFDENGVPSASLKATSSDGRFLFFNLEPGTGFITSSVGGEPIAPFVLSTVEGGEMVVKELQPEAGSLKGRLFNPVSAQGGLRPVAGARIRIEGSSDWSSTDSYGAFDLGPMKWIKGERISIEFSAERYNNHRYMIKPDHSRGPLNLYAFPATYLGRLAAAMDVDLDSYSGIVMGKVTGQKVRIDAMADHSTTNSARDYYFDASGKLRGSHTMTDSRYGTYVIFNVPRGRTLLQGNDASGVLRYSDSVVASPASVSVVMD
jgi:hypothetical protein